jgi:hypothetical protein
MESAKHSFVCMFFIALVVIPCIYIGLRPRPVYSNTEVGIVAPINEERNILIGNIEYDACVVDIIIDSSTNRSFQIVKVRDERVSDTNEIFLAFSPLSYELKNDDRVQVRKYSYMEYDGSHQFVRIVQKKY